MMWRCLVVVGLLLWWIYNHSRMGDHSDWGLSDTEDVPDEVVSDNVQTESEYKECQMRIKPSVGRPRGKPGRGSKLGREARDARLAGQLRLIQKDVEPCSTEEATVCESPVKTQDLTLLRPLGCTESQQVVKEVQAACNEKVQEEDEVLEHL